MGVAVRRRNVLISAGSVAVLFIAALTVVVVDSSHTPEQAVRDYLTLIAQGDATAANALVDPHGHTGDGEVDPARLVDGLRSAKARITINRLLTSSDPSADIVTVDVDYSLSGGHGNAALRVRREPNRFGVFTRWRVIDPLLVPVAVQTNTPAFDTAHLGAAEVPATTMAVQRDPHRDRHLHSRLGPTSFRADGHRNAACNPPLPGRGHALSWLAARSSNAAFANRRHDNLFHFCTAVGSHTTGKMFP